MQARDQVRMQVMKGREWVCSLHQGKVTVHEMRRVTGLEVTVGVAAREATVKEAGNYIGGFPNSPCPLPLPPLSPHIPSAHPQAGQLHRRVPPFTTSPSPPPIPSPHSLPPPPQAGQLHQGVPPFILFPSPPQNPSAQPPRLGNYIGGFPRAAMDPLLDLMFLPSGLNLNIVRFNIGGGSLPQYSPQLYTDSSMRWRAMPGYWPAQAAGFNWTADSRQQAVLLGAKARGVNVFEAFSNSPPWWMTASKDVSGAKKAWRTNLLRRFEGKFAKYLVKVVEGFAKNPALGNIEFDTLEPFNEGLEGQWVAGMEQEGCNFNPPEMNRVLLKTWLALRKRKLKTKLDQRARLPSAVTHVPERDNCTG
ncbi:unnamed protein product [Closterium sp. Naga37s-1]|nr:unnamed protein product [Closterium sp. Naga37s-1]